MTQTPDTTVVNDVNALVVRPPAEIERHDTDSWVEVMAPVVRLAEHIASTEFVPRGLRNNVPATTAAMLYGREVGLPPMTALSQIAVIEGRPGLSAEGMRALVLAAGHELVIDKATGAECIMRGRRRGTADWSAPVIWSIDMARAAGLAGRGPWKTYPRQMLIARASTELCRNMFPDVIHGFRSVEEIDDMGGQDEPVEPAAPVGRTRVARKRTTRKEPAEPTVPAVVESPPTSRDSAAAAPQPEDQGPPLPHELDPPLLPVEDPPDAPPEDDSAYTRMRRITRDIILHFARMGLDPDTDRPQRLDLTSRIVGRPVGTTNELTSDEADYVLATIRVIRNLPDLKRVLDVVDDNTNPTPPLTLAPEEDS